MLEKAKAGTEIADLAGRHGVSEATIYDWKSKYGGLEASDERRACRVIDTDRNSLRYRSTRDDGAGLREK